MAKSVITLSRVAQEASCSVGTVSNILKRNDSRYSDKLRKHVMHTAQKLGYQPNAGARAMQSGKFGNIAFVTLSLGTPEHHRFAEPRFIGPVTEAAASEGMSVIFEPLRIVGESVRKGVLLEPPRIFTERCVDGIIAIETAGAVPEALDEALACNGVPVVWINRKPQDKEQYTGFYSDEKEAGRQLVRHLAELGHKRIAYFGIDLKYADHFSAFDRFEGVTDEMAQLGLGQPELINMNAPVAEDTDFSNVLDGSGRATAIICYDFAKYCHAIYELGRRGFAFPDDISLCYFGNENENERYLDTTRVVSPDFEIGTQAFRKLNSLISDNSKEDISGLSFKSRLVVGKTTGKATV